MRKKKVLIVTYYWPPAGGPGVQRVLKFAKYLPQFGWEPIILTVENGEYPALDESLLNDIPAAIKVYKTKTLEPFALYKRLMGQQDKAIETYALTEKNESVMSRVFKWVRLNLFIPDARIGWKPYAVRQGIHIIKEEGVDAVLSSSPPHSLQLAAKKMAHQTHTPWLADFRDLWLDAFYIPTEEQGKRARRRNAHLEKTILTSADKVISTSREIIDDFKNKCAVAQYDVVYNGYDEQDFSNLETKGNRRFTIRYFGSISSGQNPEALFRALNELRKTKADVAALITVELYGKIDASVQRSIDNYQLADMVHFMGYVPHASVPSLMMTSDCLLLLLPRTKYKGMVPGKLFEYMAAKQAILAIGDRHSEVSDLLTRTKTGQMFDHNDSITAYLESLFRQWQKGVKTVDSVAIDHFSRKYQTEKLAQVLNDLV